MEVMAVNISMKNYVGENSIALLKTGLFIPFPFTQTLKPIHGLIHNSLRNLLSLIPLS